MPPVLRKNKVKKNGTKESPLQKEDAVISGQLQKKEKKKPKKAPSKERGVLFIKHLPHGFFEEQLKNYFEQFGKVTRLRLARSRNTGGSKGYAFVEFRFPEIAKIAAETMDNYLMFQRIVKAAYIPPEGQKYNYFKSKVRKVINKAGKAIYVSGKTANINKKVKENNDWSDAAYQKRTKANLKKLKRMQEKYAGLGINFDTLAIQPKLVTAEEAAANAVRKSESDTEENSPTGSILLVKKRKVASELTREAKKPKTGKKNQGKVKIPLKALLEHSLKEEGSSEDEDFVVENDGNNSDSSNEESYDIKLLSDVDDDDSEDDEELAPPKKNFAKPTKPQKEDRLEQIIRRKPHLGGIQKYSKKTLKDKKSVKTAKSAVSAKEAMKVAAVQEITKLGNVKQLKKADLKKNKKKASN